MCRKKRCSVDIADPLKNNFLHSCRTWWHETQLTKPEWQKVKEIGHQKVAAKCAGTPPSPPRKPSKDGKTPMRQNGWFMAVDPSTGLVLSVSAMRDRENNQIATDVLLEVVACGPHIDCVVCDRMCACLEHATAQKPHGQIKHWCIDRFRAKIARLLSHTAKRIVPQVCMSSTSVLYLIPRQEEEPPVRQENESEVEVRGYEEVG